MTWGLGLAFSSLSLCELVEHIARSLHRGSRLSDTPPWTQHDSRKEGDGGNHPDSFSQSRSLSAGLSVMLGLDGIGGADRRPGTSLRKWRRWIGSRSPDPTGSLPPAMFCLDCSLAAAASFLRL